MIKKWMTIAVALVIIGAAGLGVEFTRGNLLDRITAQVPYSKTVELEMAGIDSLVIHASTGNMRVAPYSGSKLLVRVHGTVSKKTINDIQLQAAPAAGNPSQAHIQFNHRSKWYVVPDNAKVAIEISVPQKEYNQLELRSSHADMDVDALTSKSVIVSGGSGDITLSNVSSSINIKTNTGDIMVQGKSLPADMKIYSNNGDTILQLSDNPDDVTYDLMTKNGEVKFYNQSGSNHVYGMLGNGDNQLNIKSSNGDITVRVRSDKSR
ncbi:DUF4097 family beta strand repeat-containing protein [Paenibacillus sp. GCM10023252]|uniref:DUF4097 family beta strand repeat-containing protein n=1 Tax=Paenibacillus sp. GCM10023252 TaxID=3252649 RepID=UPI00360601F3